MTQSLATVTQALEVQGGICTQMGSPFSGALARAIVADMVGGGVFAVLAEPFADRDVRGQFDDATALRFLGGLHYLVLKGEAPGLAAVYPPNGEEPNPEHLAQLVSATARSHQRVLAAFVTSPPQTNEVNRSVCLAPGFLTVARRTGFPLRCLEIGASAGLNQNWDRYRYELGDAGAWGDPASPVRLGAEWSGANPPFDVEATVAERRGCDQNPIDVRDPEQAFRLKAYVWPDQAERLARLDGAIALAQQHPTCPEKADAADWVREHVQAAAGVATVLYHSVVWQYLPSETQAAVAAAIQAAGESATKSAPFAWLRMEPNPVNLAAPMELRLTFWPGGGESLLAEVHPHGAKVSWAGD